MRGHPNRTPEQVRGRLAGLPTETERITTFGAVLRQTGLDELPQIMNIVRGEMQLIGVRPVPQEEHDLFPKDVAKIYNHHKPGLFDVTLAPRQSKGGLEDKLERIRAAEKILDRLKELELKKENIKRAAVITRLLLTIYVRKLTDPEHFKVVRDKLKHLF
jgi:hypothetical protein